MAYIEHREGFDIVYLEGRDILITALKCPKCQSTVSVKSSLKWLSTKCKCQCALLYPESYIEGRLDVISLERHKKKKGFEDGKEV